MERFTHNYEGLFNKQEGVPDKPIELKGIDAKWYKRFEALYFDDYEQLAGEDRESVEKAFLNGESDNPKLDYPKLETFNIEERESKLLELKHEILTQEPNPIIQKIYRAKINEVVAQLRMLGATKRGDDRAFQKYSEFIYGKPAPEHMGYVVDSFRKKAKAVLVKGDEEQKSAAARILEILSKAPEMSSEMVAPDVLPRLEDNSQPVQSMGEIMHEVWYKLQNQGVYDWSVVISPNPAFSASQEDKQIKIPEKTENRIEKGTFSAQSLAALIAHEVSTHAVRRSRGERSKLQLLGLGFDRYLRGEEGIAMYRQQLVGGGSEFAGLGHYFNIGLAVGYFDGVKRDFRRTFEVVRDYKIMTMKDSPDRLKKADHAAWVSCVRIFRGTTCATPGAVYSKDLAYIGNREIWTLVSKVSDATMTFDTGKFDPTNSTHIEWLTQLGIFDEDLPTPDQL